MKGLFDDFRKCTICGRYLPDNFKGDICNICQEVELFAKVKDYIRNNRVNEYQVAAHFDIPIRMIKRWIAEGRIEYYIDENSENKYLVFCIQCGIPLSDNNKGLLCPKCHKEHESLRGFSNFTIEEGKMRYKR